MKSVVSVTSAMAKVSSSEGRSEAAEINRSRTGAVAAFDDALAAIFRRAAVIAMVAGDIMPIAWLRRRGRAGGIADDRGFLALHDRLRG